MSTPSRRTLLKGAAAAGVGVATGPWVIGCGSDRTSGKRLSFWTFTQTRLDWQQNAWELYKKEKKPDFEIDWLMLPFRQMHDQLLVTAQAGSGGPDIADVEIQQFPRFIKGDVLFHDLKPKLVEMGEWENLFHASATEPWSFEDKVYGVGNELNTCLWSYRQDLCKKAGIDPEVETWDEFANVAKEFHQKTGDYLLDVRHEDWSDWFIYTLQQGGGFFDEQGNPTLDSDVSIESLAWMQQSLRDGWSILRPKGQAYWAAVSEGSIAGQTGPAWHFSGFTMENSPDTAEKWRVAPLPRRTPGGSPTATLGGTGVAVSKLSQYPDEAMDFVLWEHTSVPAEIWDFEARAVWQTYSPVFEDKRLTGPVEFFGGQKVGDVIRAATPEINTFYTSPFLREVSDALLRVALVPAVTDLSADPEQLAVAAQREAQTLIEFGSA